MPPPLAHLLPDVVALAHRAGAAILDVYAGPFDVTLKGDDSPLTIADLRSHQIIAAGLATLTPEVPVISEEAATVALAERRAWDWVWLVDPLDGTKEFVSRNGEFTVNIALIHHQAPVLGVLHVPLSGTTWQAAKGAGAWRTGPNDAPRRVSVRAHLEQPVRVVGSRSHRGGGLDALLARLGAHRFQALGSASKFGLIAEGSADLYPRLGPTSEWDTAAGQAIVEIAGGAVVARDGQPLRYNARETLLNPDFICYGDASRAWHELL